MTDIERVAFQQYAVEALKTRADLIHERRCIDSAMDILRGATKIATGNGDDRKKLEALFDLVDDARKALQAPVPK